MLHAMGEVPIGLPVEIPSGQALWVTCQRRSSLTSAERIVYGIVMAMIGDAGSTAAIIIAFSLGVACWALRNSPPWPTPSSRRRVYCLWGE